MTKRMVRAAVLACLAPAPDAIVWDVGAGTGSVSVELAAMANRGKVFAVECREEACDLIEANRRKFAAWNLRGVCGKAPEALQDLPRPDAVFIGGTRGSMAEIVRTALSKNPAVRLCITAIALESLSSAMEVLQSCGIKPDITQVAVNQTKAAGHVHMLTAQNPIFIITGNCDD